MKKLFSIGFLFIFLINTGGYYFIFLGLRNQAKHELVRRLDSQAYSESETIELSIPINLPYQLNEQGFERVDGDFTYQGHIYRLVKQKLENGVLHVVCILSKKEKLLNDALSDFAQLSTAVPSTSKQAVTLLTKLLRDFENNSTLQVIQNNGWSRHISPSATPVPRLLAGNNSIFIPPPWAV